MTSDPYSDWLAARRSQAVDDPAFVGSVMGGVEMQRAEARRATSRPRWLRLFDWTDTQSVRLCPVGATLFGGAIRIAIVFLLFAIA